MGCPIFPSTSDICKFGELKYLFYILTILLPQYIFILISHTYFDMPCDITTKIDLACGARGPGFDSRSCRYDFRDWLSPASKSRYG